MVVDKNTATLNFECLCVDTSGQISRPLGTTKLTAWLEAPTLKHMQ